MAGLLDDEQSDGNLISIVGTGMTIEGDSETEGSLRIEGTVRGNVRAGKSVVLGKDGLIEGNIFTQNAVIAGRVLGAIYAESCLEIQATSVLFGEIQARQIHVEVGAALQGQMAVGEGAVVKSAPKGDGSGSREGQDPDPST